MEITEQMLKEAQEIIRLHELQLRKNTLIESLPILEHDMILEYQDLAGSWYEYTTELQKSIHFYPPLKIRVRKILIPEESIDVAAKLHAGFPKDKIIDYDERYYQSNKCDKYDSFIKGALSLEAKKYWEKI